MRDAFTCDAIRTPIGRYGGALSAVRADDLAAIPLKTLLRRNSSLEAAAIEDVVLGCANQAGEDNRNVARMAGLPASVPGLTINRLCGSGLVAIAIGARMIRTGEADVVVAGGVESMSRAPYVLSKSATPLARDVQLFDTTIGWRFANPLIKQQYGIDSMPETAENVAADFRVSRAAQDRFALRSQERALAAQANGILAAEIVPVAISPGRSQSWSPRRNNLVVCLRAWKPMLSRRPRACVQRPPRCALWIQTTCRDWSGECLSGAAHRLTFSGGQHRPACGMRSQMSRIDL
jgi:acetyl-CoA acetyltransferase family protein